MRLFQTFAIVAALLFAGAQTAEAQIRQQLVELNLLGSLQTVSNGESVTSSRVDVRAGYFFTPELEIGFAINSTKVESLDAYGSIGIFGAYHFADPLARTVPFAGAQFGSGFGNDSGTAYGVFGGLKYFITPGGAIIPQAFIQQNGDLTEYGLQAGIALFF